MKPTRYTPELITEYVEKGYWDSMTLSRLWDINAEKYPNEEAVVDSRSRFTWAEAREWTDRVAMGLIELGIDRDEVLAVQLPNFAELALLRVAAEKAGVLFAPVLRSLREREMEYILHYLDAAAIVIPGKYSDFDHLQMVRNLQPGLPRLKYIIVTDEKATGDATGLPGLARKTHDRDLTKRFLDARRFDRAEFSLIAHTSGTTGMPKFVEFSAAARVVAGKGIAKLLDLTQEDVLAALGPASGGPNNGAYYGGPVVGAKLAMLEVFQARPALELMQKERVTVACVSPAHLAMMLAEPDFNTYDLSSLRYLFSAGAPLTYELGKETEARFGRPVLNCLGAVDCGALIATSPHSSQEDRLLTVGKPIAHAEVKIADEQGGEVPIGEIGEIYLRGPSCAGGYFKDAESTWKAWSKDGWFKMGDLGKMDSKGNLVMVGRKKDLIIRGGQNIYPLEVENMLQGHPKVAGVAVVGMPDRVMGEKACAFVVPRPGQTFTFPEMVAFLKKGKIASYKLPERLEIIDRIPLAAEQKPDKKVLRAMIAEKLKAEGK
ncbi:MAG: AMP-binding protein [Chloroflexi bacterium]|nr:AMP-binding protein [Chloroflexota bacterium]